MSRRSASRGLPAALTGVSAILVIAGLHLVGCFIDTDGVLLSGVDGGPEQDLDGDGIADDVPDNCISTPNRAQADFDDDGEGNSCDDDAPGTDVDADGIDDGVDQCLGETSGTNEDGDRHPDIVWQLVDSCDNCPAVPNAQQANADRDDIGDLCEHPLDETLFANIALFDGLRNDIMGWRILDVSGWSFDSGALTASSTSILHTVVPDRFVDVLGTRYAIESVLEIDALPPDDGVFAGVLIATNVNSAATNLESWEACVLTTDTASTGELVLSLRAMAPGCADASCRLGEVLREEPTGVSFDFGQSYRLYASRNGNNLACWIGPTATQVDASVSLTASTVSPSGPGLVVSGTTGRFLRATVFTP